MPATRPDRRPRAEAAQEVSDLGHRGVAGPLAREHVFGPSDRVVAVETVGALDVGAGGDQQPDAFDRPERRGEVQRATALVRAGVRVGVVRQQPRHGCGPLVLSRVHERFVKDVPGILARRKTLEPPDVGGVRPIAVGLRDQPAAPVEEPIEALEEPGTRRHPRRVRHQRDRGEDVDRRP